MDLIDKPAAARAGVAHLRRPASTGRRDPRLDGVAEELAQAVARGDVSREQADAFLARLTPRSERPRPRGASSSGDLARGR